MLLEEGDAMLTLVLQPEQFMRRNVSLTAQTRAAELELTLSADFTLNQQASNPIDARATVTRQMLNDPRNVVGKPRRSVCFAEKCAVTSLIRLPVALAMAWVADATETSAAR